MIKSRRKCEEIWSKICTSFFKKKYSKLPIIRRQIIRFALFAVAKLLPKYIKNTGKQNHASVCKSH